ncbi:hypothetical protein QC762_123540 [Podospora pseudocomata]|uniref:Uncharacterized protein n=1 Tax=Podospora pseudocomata TaxID=2093779 RepID=A0ABR0GYS5_9PEZI|nr:hypothetical protein QC762_123540 [Podospora pseudocomata]
MAVRITARPSWRTNETTDELDSGAAVGLEDEQTYHVDTECPHHCKEKIYITVTLPASTVTLPASTVTLPATTVTEKTTQTETVYTTQTNEVSVSVPVSVTVIKGTTEYITTTQLSTVTTLVPVPTTIKVCNTKSPYLCSTKTTTELVPTTTTRTIKKTVPTTVTKVKVITKWKEVTTTKTKTSTYTTKKTIPITVIDSTTLYSTKTETLKTTLTTVETTSVPTTLTQKETQTQTQTVKTTETVPTTILQTSTVVSLVTLTTSFPVTVTDSTTLWSTQTTVFTTTSLSTFTTVSTMTTVHAVTATVTQLTTTTVSVCAAPTNAGIYKRSALDVRSKKHPRALRTWGCEPGFVCNQPKPGGCNLWAEAPGLDFECHPDWCVPAPYIPRVVWKKNETGYFPPVEGYFNLNPEDFGLSYGVFELQPVVVLKADGRLATSYTGDWASQATITERTRSTDVPNSGARFVKRQRPGSDVVPATCFNLCDSAYLEAQRVGRDPDLCAPGSVFLDILDECKVCIAENTDDTKYEEIERVYLEPNFRPWLDYCDTLPGVPITTTTSGEPQVTDTASVSTDTGLPPNTSTGFDDFTTSTTTTSSEETSTPTSTPTSTDETTSTTTDSSTETTLTETTSTTSESTSSTETLSSETTSSETTSSETTSSPGTTETTNSPSTETTTESPTTETTEVPTSGGSESTLPGETSGGGDDGGVVPTDTPTTIAGTGGLTPTLPTGPVVTAAAGRMANVPSLGGLGNILAGILFAAMLL